MNFNKLVFHEKNWPDVIGRTLTINFDKCELELLYSEGLLSCCITQKECSAFKERLALCQLDDWSETYEPPAGIAVLDGSSWSLALFDGEKQVKDICGMNGFPPMELWSKLTSVLDDGYTIALKHGKKTPLENVRRKLF